MTAATLRTIALGAALGLLAAGCGTVESTSKRSPALPVWPSMSGIAEVAPGRLVVAHDAKPDSGSPTLGLIEIGQGSDLSTYQPIRVDAAIDPPFRDLESVVCVPDATNSVIVLESGSGKRPRRIAWLDVHSDARGTIATVVGQPVDVRRAAGGITNSEAIAVERVRSESRQADLLVADRSPLAADGDTRVTVYRISVDFSTGIASAQGIFCVYMFTPPAGVGAPRASWRACTDLVLESDGDLLAAAAIDGGARGPFASVIYRVAGVRAASGADRPCPVVPIATIDGFKIEGLGRSFDGASIWFSTDDEAMGGAVRSLAYPGW